MTPLIVAFAKSVRRPTRSLNTLTGIDTMLWKHIESSRLDPLKLRFAKSILFRVW